MTLVRRTVDLAGVILDLDAESPDLARYLDWHFGLLPDSPRRPDLLVRGAAGPRLRTPDGPPRQDGPLSCWDSAERLWLRHEAGGWAFIHDDTLEICLPQHADEWRITRQMLFTALSWFLDRRSLLLLHAGLVGIDDEAVLLLGATTRGKSTAAVSALLAGWQLGSDDLSVIRAGAVPSAFGVPKRAMVERPVASRLAPEAARGPADARGRIMLPADLFTVGWRHVRAVVVLDHHHGDGELRHLTHEEALAQLLASFLDSDRPASLRRQLGGLAGLAALPAFSLGHSADPDARLERSAQMLGEVWQATGRR